MKKTILVGIGLLAMVGIADAQDKRQNPYQNTNPMMQYQEPKRIYPTIPYTPFRDYSRGDGYVVDRGVLRPVIPYTNIPDLSRPGEYMMDD